MITPMYIIKHTNLWSYRAEGEGDSDTDASCKQKTSVSTLSGNPAVVGFTP